eukprot:symbB.v1.2.038893.t1/scaffold6228.1/size21795/3
MAMTLEPALVWGIFCRLVGFTLFAQAVQIHLQVLPLAGSQGVFPAAPFRQALRRDFSPLQRILYFPSLLELNASDIMLKTISLTMLFGAVLYLIFGFWACLLVAHICHMSLMNEAKLAWPWDHVLFETCSLLLLSGCCGLNLWSWQSCNCPSNMTLFVLRLLLFRVVFGFGKLKFLDDPEVARGDRLYLKMFVKIIPFPTPGGHLMFCWPEWLLAMLHNVYWACEIICPFGYFMPAMIRIPCAVSCVLLMLGIQFAGNFGHFQFLVGCLCTPLLIDLNFQDFDTGSWLSAIILSMHAIVSLLLVVIANSWVSRSWFDWPACHWLPSLRPLCLMYRVLMKWGIMHAYGVFPPGSMAIVRNYPAYQASTDGGKTWHEYQYRFLDSQGDRPARFLPLLTPRLDWISAYLGIDGPMTSLFESGPYMGLLIREYILLSVLTQKKDALQLFQSNPLEGCRKPTHARVILRTFVPNPEYSPYDLHGGSKAYLSHDSEDFFPPVTLDQLNLPVYALSFSHVDSWSWRDQSRHWKRILEEVDGLAGKEMKEVNLGKAEEKEEKEEGKDRKEVDVQLLQALDQLLEKGSEFWSGAHLKRANYWFKELLPKCQLQPLAPMNDCGLAYALERAEAVRKEIGGDAWQKFAHQGHYLMLYLLHRLETYYFTNDKEKEPKMPSFYHLGLFCAAMVLRGIEAVSEVLSASHPSDKFENEVLMKWDWREGLAAMAFLHPTQYRHLSVCARLLEHYQRVTRSDSSDSKLARIIPGFVKVYGTYLTRREVVPFVNLQFVELRKQNDLLWPLASLGPQHGQGQVKTPLLLHGRHGEKQMQVPLLARQGV